MDTKLAGLALALAVTLALPGAARAEQKGKPAACPTTGSFSDPSACECPPGFGKILLGTGGGECKPKTCAVGKEVDPKLCQCPEGYEKKSAKAGKVTCVRPKPKA